MTEHNRGQSNPDLVLPEMPLPPMPPPDEDSPLPCRCYFINGTRITDDCKVGHNRTWNTEEASVLVLAALNAPDKARNDALLTALHSLVLIASDDHADARFARRQLVKIEEAVKPNYQPRDPA